MKTIMRSFFMIGLLLNVNYAFTIKEKRDTTTLRIMQAGNKILSAEQQKKKLRYGAVGLGLVGIGGLLYSSWKADAIQLQADQLLNNMVNGTANVQQQAFARECTRKGYTVIRNNIYMALPGAPAPALSRLGAIKKYLVNTAKDSFLGLSTLGVSIFMMGIQGIGANFLTKNVLHPLADKFAALYSLERFIGTQTNLNQNIKNVIIALSSMEKDSQATESYRNSFTTSFALLEQDIIKVLGFMLYINSLIKKSDSLIVAQAREIFLQAKKCLANLHQLKTQAFDLKKYKAVLFKFIDHSEGFAALCSEAGTDFMEDIYASMFKELRKSVNIDDYQKIEAEKNRVALEYEKLQHQRNQAEIFERAEQYRAFQAFMSMAANPQALGEMPDWLSGALENTDEALS